MGVSGTLFFLSIDTIPEMLLKFPLKIPFDHTGVHTLADVAETDKTSDAIEMFQK